MPVFGSRSERELATVHPLLQRLFREVVRHWDCTILEGHRSPERQEELFRRGLSQVRRGGKHTMTPALAVDVAPWFRDPPHVRWQDTRAFYAFGGFVLGIAAELGIRIRWGADWDGDHEFGDHTLVDTPHFELVAPSG